MSPQYFATFASGLQEIITNKLQTFAKSDVTVNQVQDGLALFSSSLSEGQLTELRFFNNVFRLLADLGVQPNIDAAAMAAANSAMHTLPKGARFTIHTRVASQTAGLKNLPALQQAVAAATGGTPDSFTPNVELLLWVRADGRSIWGRRLPRPGFKTRSVEPGELRPDIAHAMGLLAGLDHKHTVLDPFAGYGAIVRECLQGFHCEHVIAVEHNEHLVPHLKSVGNLVAMHGDAARLPHIETRSIDRVITDPPWGKFTPASRESLHHLYHEVFIQMHRVLRTKGCVVMLTAVDFVGELADSIGFTVEKQYSVLVNGQKATLYKLRKFAA